MSDQDQSLADNGDEAAAAGLLYVNDAAPGIRRRRAGTNFRYVSVDGSAIRDDKTLDRIRALAIPPAYTDVWICASPRGHLQATGRDARGRKQYRYHPRWQTVRGEGKFERIITFGGALPTLRRRLRADLKRRGLPREKVVAIVVALMAESLARVGNDEYARTNHSYGLTTLRSRHVAFLRGGRAQFKFRGKGGKAQEIAVDDARLVKLVRACQELPGQVLFQYKDPEGRIQPVDSDAVNAYLHVAMGESYTAKDFRTWGATLHAFRLFAATPLPEPDADGHTSERAFASSEAEVVKQVAQVLGNTPAVCRKSYIDPAILDAWRNGDLQRAAGKARGSRQWEQAALKLLRRARRQAARPGRKRGK